MSNENELRLLRAEKVELHGQEQIFATVNRTLAPGDGMYKGNDAAYLGVGANALRLIQHALEAGRSNVGQVQRVLDYACGFGRVLRWLQAGFPHAQIVAVDSDPKAVNAVKEIFDVDASVLDLSLRKEIGREFDLIWVGSLTTHLPEWETLRTIQYLKAHLTKGGVLVLTTHGDLVYQRLRLRERHYNIDEGRIGKIIREFDRLGYGHASYGRASYGISVSKPSRIVTMIEACNLVCVYFKARGWAAHQDVFGCVNP